MMRNDAQMTPSHTPSFVGNLTKGGYSALKDSPSSKEKGWWRLGQDFKSKPYVHILAALSIWAFVVALLAQEQGSTVMLHLDQVHTYALSKVPATYDGMGGARATIINAFNTYWLVPNDEAVPNGCFYLVNWTGNSACQTKRQTLVTSTRTAMGCDLYKSAACNCLNQVLKAIANDTTSLTSSVVTGVFQTVGRNLSGQQPSILAALDACHFMHHPPYIATETLASGAASTSNVNANSWIRRVGLLFVLSTMVTGNAVLYFVFPPGAFGSYGTALRTLAVLVWPVVSLATVAGIEGAAVNVLLYIVLPPFLILVWYSLTRARAISSCALTPARAISSCVLTPARAISSCVLTRVPPAGTSTS